MKEHLWPCLFIPGVLVDEYMAAHGDLNEGHLLVILVAVPGVLHVQAHDLGVSFREPPLVHVEDLLQCCWVVGADHHDLLVAMDGDVVRLGEEVDGVHGDAAGEKKIILQWKRRRREEGKQRSRAM